jgi:hypothetical protein
VPWIIVIAWLHAAVAAAGAIIASTIRVLVAVIAVSRHQRGGTAAVLGEE